MSLTDLQSKKIQVVRGLCIIAVVITHCIVYAPYELRVAPFIHFAVPVFIFLSGMLTSCTIDRIGTFYKKRLFRVFVPYIIWSCLYALLYPNGNSFFFNFFTGQCCSIYYYILVYMQLVILTPLIAKLVCSKFFWLGYIISPILIFASYYLAYKGAYPIYPFNINNCFIWIGFYIFGMRCRLKREEACGQTSLVKESGNIRTYFQVDLKTSLKFVYILVAIVFVLLLLYMEYRESGLWSLMGQGGLAGNQAKITSYFASMIIANLFYLWIFWDKKQNNDLDIFSKILLTFFKEVGDASFGIYLSHQLLMKYIGQLSFWNSMNICLRVLLITFVSYALVKILHFALGKYGRSFGV